jgi:hypothetical protein
LPSLAAADITPPAVRGDTVRVIAIQLDATGLRYRAVRFLDGRSLSDDRIEVRHAPKESSPSGAGKVHLLTVLRSKRQPLTIVNAEPYETPQQDDCTPFVPLWGGVIHRDADSCPDAVVFPIDEKEPLGQPLAITMERWARQLEAFPELTLVEISGDKRNVTRAIAWLTDHGIPRRHLRIRIVTGDCRYTSGSPPRCVPVADIDPLEWEGKPIPIE